jgi:hypothetical protein
MICKKMLLGAFLVVFCVGHLKAEEENLPEDTIDAAEMINMESDYTDEENEEFEDEDMEAAANIMADAIVAAAKIVSNGIIVMSQTVAEKQVEAAEKFGLESAKVVADTIIETAKIVSEKQVEATEKFGLEAAKVAAEAIVEIAKKTAEKRVETAKQWATIAKATISTVGMLILFSILR